jgi:DnaK suppressor protein
MKKKKSQAPKKKAKPAALAKVRKTPAKSTPKAKPVAKSAAKAASKASKAAAPQRAASKPAQGFSKPTLVQNKSTTTTTLPPDYRPLEKEPFMNPRQHEYFRRKLLAWRVELLKESEETLESLQEGGLQEPDLADRASAEMERSLELRTRDRARKLISKIDAALRRLEDGSYGYCEETGEPIGLKRLEARPIATLSVEAQERHERMERTHRSD